MACFLRATLLLALFAPLTQAASQRVAQDGFEPPCEADADRDRLSNCTEAVLLTERFDPDTDGDGLPDGDEVLGTPSGLDLPGFGVSPLKRDLLLEIDWVNDNDGCLFHSHRPSPQVIGEIQQVFAAVSLDNPDGSSGINLIVDYGQSTLFTGGNLIGSNGTISIQDLQALHQPSQFAANRRGYFRYSIHAHSQGLAEEYSGIGVGDENLVTLGCRINTPGYVRNVTVHELGHNLGLQHGGAGSCNRKPNYNSVMNYNYIFEGLDINCDRFPDGVDYVGFSEGRRRPLLESALIEDEGVCAPSHPAAKPVDWNFNGVIDASPDAVELACPGTSLIEDWNDVERLQLPPRAEPGVDYSPPLPPDEPCPVPPALGELQ